MQVSFKRNQLGIKATLMQIGIFLKKYKLYTKKQATF